jgi:outer membrane protein assembly factor BamD (BamD/ComL family)
MRKTTSLLVFSVALCLLSGCARRSKTTTSKKNSVPKTSVGKDTQRPSKKVELMTIDEARQAAAYYKEVGNERNQAIALERVILLTGDPGELSTLMHSLAILHEKLGNYEDAGTVYEQYTKLFPGNADINYMTYKMVEILSKQIRDVLHDQTKIKLLTEQADAFLERFGEKDKHSKWVSTLRTYGYQMLTRSEIARARFYLDRYEYTQKMSALRAAGKRLEEAEKVLVNLDLGEKNEKAIEAVMDAIRAEDFDKKSADEQLARITKAIAVLAPIAGEEVNQATTAASFFKRMF